MSLLPKLPRQPQLLQTGNIFIIAHRLLFLPLPFPQQGSWLLPWSGDGESSLPKVEEVFSLKTLLQLAAQRDAFSMWYLNFIIYNWCLSYAYGKCFQCAYQLERIRNGLILPQLDCPYCLRWLISSWVAWVHLKILQQLLHWHLDTSVMVRNMSCKV